MVAAQSQGGLTNSYQLDSAGRPRELKVTGSKEATEVFHYAGGSDSPAWTAKGSEWTRNIGGIGGELTAIQSSSGETSLELTSLHGDVVATASLSPTAKEPTAKFEFDEFGNPKSGKAGRFGWLGGKQRRAELPSGVIQMGARSYVPAMGRFVSVDPVPGGSANTYDYSNGDPVNGLDLTGMKPWDRACDPGFAGCKCILSADFEQLSHHRMQLQWRRACHVATGVTKTGWAVGWGKGDGDGFSSISAPPSVRVPSIHPPPPVCRDTDPCQKNRHGMYTFYCEPGKEYQFSATWGYNIGFDHDPVPESQLHVSIQQFCL